MASYQTLSNVYEDVRYIAGKDSTTLTDDDLLRMANKYYLLMVRELVGLNEDIYAEISSTNLVANQREYQLPIDDVNSPWGGGLIKLQRVEVNYTDANADSWKVATPTSLQEFQGPTILDSELNAQYDKSAPAYWFKDRAVWLAPVPDANVTDGLYIYWIRRPVEMTATSDQPDVPKDFLNILTEGILIDVFRKYNRQTESDRARENWFSWVQRMRELEQNIDQEQIYRMQTVRKNYE